MSLCIQEKLFQLSPAHRMVISLHDLGGLSQAEAAQALEISSGALRVRLHRARQALKEILERECTFERDQRNVFVCIPKAGV